MSSDQRSFGVIALAALLSHIASLSAGFIWLDHAHLEQGLALAQTSSLSALFKQGFAGTSYYRPLMAASLSLDAALGGAPWLYHATTLLWHAGAAIMVCVAGRRLGLTHRAALGAGLLFAVHPATAVVANAIAFRSEAMIAVSLLGLVTAHLDRKAGLSGALLCTAALCKETALGLGPLFLLALELFEPAARGSARQRLALWAAEGLGLTLALGLRLSFAPPWRAGFPALEWDEALGTRLASVTKSARAIVLPVDLGVCDAFPIMSLATSRALVGLGVLLGLGYLAWRRRGPALLLLCALLPSLQLVPVARWWSSHYVYLPLAFASMLLLQAVERWVEPALRWLGPAALALGGIALVDARRYASDESFWSHEVKLEPGCREGHFYLGDAALARGRFDTAAAHYERALASTPGVLSYVDRTAALQNLGAVRLRQGRLEDALDAFRSALDGRLDPTARRHLEHNLKIAELAALRARGGAGSSAAMAPADGD